MLKLVGTDGNRLFTWVLDPGKYTVGRKAECDISVPHRTVSRNHAEIAVSDDGECVVTDLGSHNGTTVNGIRITGRATIAVNDKVAFGQTEFNLVDADSEAPAAGSAAPATLVDDELENSVFLSINEALQPLTAAATESREVLPTIFEMAKMLVSPETKESMLQRSLELVAKVISAQRLAVLFVSEDQDEVYTAATLLTQGGEPGAFQLSRTIVREIMTNKNAILIGDPLNDPRFAEQHSIIMQEIRSALAVPLFDEGRVLGILYADTTNPVHQYSNEQLRIMATFGNIIAAKLLSYELESERQSKEIMDAELRRAASIQRRLLETEVPKTEGWEVSSYQEPSRSVGGDLFEIKALDEGRLLLMVADVSGKGMGAALLMSNILASFRTIFDEESVELPVAVRRVSRQILNYSDPEDFATLFIAVAESDGKLHYINAGHNSPMLLRANGEIDLLEPCGIMIGAFDFAEWPEQTVTMTPGETLLVFSDGVTEAMCGEQQYGEERVTKVLQKGANDSPATLLKLLTEDIREFVGDNPQSDDITMLAFKRTNS